MVSKQMTTEQNMRNFGIELEVIGSAAKVLRAVRARGISIENEGYNHNTRSHWKIVSDASLSSGGFEVVSPILTENTMWQVTEICEALVEAGCKVDRSCGMHVHVDANGMTLNQGKNLVKMFAKYESNFDEVLPVSRRANNSRWCRSIISGNLESTFRMIDQCQTLMGLTQSVNPSRYYKLNLHSFWRHGTVEFRQHSGTIEAAKVCNWIKLIDNFVGRAFEAKSVKAAGAGKFENMIGNSGTKKFYKARKEALA